MKQQRIKSSVFAINVSWRKNATERNTSRIEKQKFKGLHFDIVQKWVDEMQAQRKETDENDCT